MNEIVRSRINSNVFFIIDHPIRNKAEFIEKYEFDLIKTEGSLLYFQTKEPLNNPGTHQYALRVFPKNPDLPHRMDFAYVRWI